MWRFEYLEDETDGYPPIEYLNHKGSEGWELVNVMRTSYSNTHFLIFKREYTVKPENLGDSP